MPMDLQCSDTDTLPPPFKKKLISPLHDVI